MEGVHYKLSPAPWCGIAIQVRRLRIRDCSTFGNRDCSTSRIRDCSTSRIKDCSTSRIRDCSTSGIRDCSRNCACFLLMFSSPLDLRTEISAQLRREITRTGDARLFGFDQIRVNRPNIAEKSIYGSTIRPIACVCSKSHPNSCVCSKNHPQ